MLCSDTSLRRLELMAMKFDMPYGTGSLPLDLPDERVRQVLFSRTESMDPGRGGDEIVRAALLEPIGSPSLAQLARGKRTATIIISDHTRPVPSKQILPWLLAELRSASPAIDVTLLVATGCHRGTTQDELIEKLGAGIAASEKIIIHDCADGSSLAEAGVLPSGAPLIVNRAALETDLLLAEGFIEPHFFAGFSGGRKSVLPGICARKTVLGNHCGAFIASPEARSGQLEGNPIHRDMMAAARLVNLAFILNVVINDQKKILAAFAGDPAEAHIAGCAWLNGICRVQAGPAELVVTSNGGVPLDQNIYQAVKGLCTAEAAAAPDAVLILCAECRDGTGGDHFYRALRDCASPAVLYGQFCQVPMDETEPDQWQAQILARILMRHPVVFVTRPELRQVVGDMKMHYAASLDEALAIAGRLRGQALPVTVIPNGVSIVVDQ